MAAVIERCKQRRDVVYILGTVSLAVSVDLTAGL